MDRGKCEVQGAVRPGATEHGPKGRAQWRGRADGAATGPDYAAAPQAAPCTRLTGQLVRPALRHMNIQPFGWQA